MGHPDTYYLAQLSPAPIHVCIRNNSHPAGTVWLVETCNPNTLYINVLQSGSIRELWENGTVQLLVAGSVYVDVGGSRFQQKLLTDLHEVFMRIVFSAPPLVLSAHEAAARLLSTHEVLLPGQITDPEAARQVIRILLDADKSAPPGDELRSMKLRTAMYEILLTLTRCAKDQARHQQQQKEKKWSRSTTMAVYYIKEHLAQKISVEDVSRAAESNYNHLKTVFRREIGMTMVEYINYLRIQQAKELIFRQNCTAEAAGEAVGISDPKYLRRLFRRYTGMNVSEYRRICRTSRKD